MNRKRLTLFSIIMTVLVIYIILENIKHNDPLKEISDRRIDVIQNIDVLGFEEHNDEILYFTRGEIINASNLFYAVDWVKKTWLGYRWVNGGGHTDTDVKDENTMTMQYIGAFIDRDEIIFGILYKADVSKIIFELDPLRIESELFKNQSDKIFYFCRLKSEEIQKVQRIILVDSFGNETVHQVDTSALINQSNDFRFMTIDLNQNM